MKQPHALVRDVNFWRSPLCPGVELRQASYRRQTFHRHSHPTYSLGVVVRGVTEFVYRGQRQRAQAGDLVLIAPDEVHDCNPFGDEPLAYWMFYLDAAVLGAPAQAYFDRAVYRDPALFALWLSQAQGLRAWCETENAALAQAWRQELEALWRRTWQAWPSCAPKAADQPEPAPWLRQVRRQLRADLTQPLALQELSARVGISPSHLNRRFGPKSVCRPIVISCSCVSMPPRPSWRPVSLSRRSPPIWALAIRAISPACSPGSSVRPRLSIKNLESRTDSFCISHTKRKEQFCSRQQRRRRLGSSASSILRKAS